MATSSHIEDIINGTTVVPPESLAEPYVLSGISRVPSINPSLMSVSNEGLLSPTMASANPLRMSMRPSRSKVVDTYGPSVDSFMYPSRNNSSSQDSLRNVNPSSQDSLRNAIDSQDEQRLGNPPIDQSMTVDPLVLYTFLRDREPDPEVVLLVRQALIHKLIDPTIALVQVIATAKARRSLLLVGMCLRNGADPNAYVSDGDLQMHILCYAYHTILPYGYERQPDAEMKKLLIALVTIMMMASGTDLQRQARAPQSGQPVGPTVAKWLVEHSYVNLEHYRNVMDRDALFESFRVERLNAVALILDRPELIRGTLTSADYLLATQSLSSLITRIPLPTTCVSGSNQGLWDAFTNLYSDAFIDVIERGKVLPSYGMMAMMLVATRKYSTVVAGPLITKGDEVVVQEITRMITAALANGYEIDQREYNYMIELGSTFIVAVRKAYDSPFWKKSLSRGKITTELRGMAVALGFRPDEPSNVLYQQFDKLSSIDGNMLAAKLQERQQRLLYQQLAYPSELLVEPLGKLRLAQNEIDPANPNYIYNYGYYDTVGFRDDRGLVHIYLSNMFPILLKDGIADNQMLPQSVSLEMKAKLLAVDRDLNIINNPISITDAVKMLREPDSISQFRGNDETSKCISSFKDYAIQSGYHIDPDQLTTAKINSALQYYNYKQIDVTPLTIDYAYAVLCRSMCCKNGLDSGVYSLLTDRM